MPTNLAVARLRLPRRRHKASAKKSIVALTLLKFCQARMNECARSADGEHDRDLKVQWMTMASYWGRLAIVFGEGRGA